MTTTFRREMGRNYLVLVGEAEDEVDYQLRMLTENVLTGFAPASIRMQDHRVELYYDITSKQPLSRVYERQPITTPVVSRILQQLQQAREEAEQYLIDGDRILLEPSMMYMDCASGKIYLCLGFSKNHSIKQGLEALLGFFLKQVSREDYACVGMVYGLYQESQKEEISLLELLAVGERELEEALKHAPKSTVPILYAQESTALTLREETDKYETEVTASYPKPKSPLWRFRLWKRRRRNRKHREIQRGSIAVEGDFSEEETDSFLEGKISPIYEDEKNVQVQPNVSKETREEKPRFITQSLEEISPKDRVFVLRSRFPEQYEDIVLIDYPFIIGTMPGLTDATQNNRLISRFHARLEKREEWIIVMDLNSSNGTFVNGERLTVFEEQKLQEGDAVSFANQQYIFEQARF